MSRRFFVEADGGSRGNPGPAAYGAVVRDADTGEVLAELAEFFDQPVGTVAFWDGGCDGDLRALPRGLRHFRDANDNVVCAG